MNNEIEISNEALRIDEYPFTIRPMTEEEGSGYLIEFPDIPGCISDGETPEEAVVNGKDALRSVLLTMREFGDPIPDPRSRSVVVIPAALRSRLEKRADKEHTSPGDLATEIIAEGLSTREPAA
jgi:antitoxin HicB